MGGAGAFPIFAGGTLGGAFLAGAGRAGVARGSRLGLELVKGAEGVAGVPSWGLLR